MDKLNVINGEVKIIILYHLHFYVACIKKDFFFFFFFKSSPRTTKIQSFRI